MSNIHQNDELLRVQDQNYDIVFNYDKHENGGVAVHAEKDGKNHKVNPEYARAALVKQIGAGGGWPSDLPKPSVGGYGYTEQGEQTVIVDESVTTDPCYDVNQGQFATPFDIVEGAYTVIFNGTEYNLNSTAFGESVGYFLGGEIGEEGIDFSLYPFMIASINENAVLYTESAGDYEITVKAPTDIIHKINNKYLNVVETAVLSTNAERLEIMKVFEKFYSCYQDGLILRLGIYDEEYPEHIHYYDCDCAVDFHIKQNCEFHFSKTHIMIGQMQIVSIRLRRNDLEVKEHWITL